MGKWVLLAAKEKSKWGKAYCILSLRLKVFIILGTSKKTTFSNAPGLGRSILNQKGDTARSKKGSNFFSFGTKQTSKTPVFFG